MAESRQLDLAFQGETRPELSSVIGTSQHPRTAVTSTQLPEEVRRVISEFTPRSVSAHRWDANCDFIRGIVTDHAPDSCQAAQSALRVVGQIVAYAMDCHLPLDRETILSPDFVERFVHHLETVGKSTATVGTYHSVLRVIGPSVTVMAPWKRPVPHGRTNTPPPYDQRVIDAYIRNASAQSTLLRQNQPLVIVGLGAGAGLRPGEIRSFQGQHLDRHGHVAVSGDRPRTVPVSSDLLDALIEGIANEPGRVFADHKNALNDAYRRLRFDSSLPPLKIRRLRNTWISNQLDRLTVVELMELSGLGSVRVIDDLLRMRSVHGGTK